MLNLNDFLYFNRTGQFCDECIRLPGCVHGTCSKAFECSCDDGFEGMVCDKRMKIILLQFFIVGVMLQEKKSFQRNGSVIT